MNVDFRVIQIQKLHVCDCHCRESLIDLVVVDILHGEACALKHSLGSNSGCNTKINRGNTSILISHNPGQRCQATNLRSLLRHHDECACTVVNLRCICRRNGTSLGKCRLKRWELIRHELLTLFIQLNSDIALLSRLHDFSDFPVKEPSSLCGTGAVVRLNCESILCLSGDTHLRANLFNTCAHQNVVIYICETVGLNRVLDLCRSVCGRSA
jgi:hypothetical protein